MPVLVYARNARRKTAPTNVLQSSLGKLGDCAENPIESGAPGEIRTPDTLVRSQVLYPTELRARD